MKRGFTLIEMIVVVSALGIMMTAVVMVLSGVGRGKQRVEQSDLVEQNGTFILGELRKIGLEAKTSGVTCPPSGVGAWITAVNYKDGGMTTISCVDGGQIASSSANGNFDFISSGIRLSGCNTFVSCDTLPDVGVSALNFSFKLGLGSSDYGGGLVEREFNSRVVVRN